jgi:hypothetical protein
MTILLGLLLIADGAIYLASRSRGEVWAEQICQNARMLCENSSWLAIFAIVIGSVLVVQRLAR